MGVGPKSAQTSLEGGNIGAGGSSVHYLDAPDAGFAVVAFDVDFNFGVADEAETQTRSLKICCIK